MTFTFWHFDLIFISYAPQTYKKHAFWHAYTKTCKLLFNIFWWVIFLGWIITQPRYTPSRIVCWLPDFSKSLLRDFSLFYFICYHKWTSGTITYFDQSSITWFLELSYLRMLSSLLLKRFNKTLTKIVFFFLDNFNYAMRATPPPPWFLNSCVSMTCQGSNRIANK